MKSSSATNKSSFSSPATNAQQQQQQQQQQQKKIGRPINCFIAFRLEKHRQISSQSPGLNHRAISKIIAKWWKEATELEKAPYRLIAEKAKAEHAKKYPDYKYRPVKKSQRNVRPYRRREDAITRERKSNAQKQLLKQWLGDEDMEDTKDNRSEASFSPSSSSSSFSVNTIQQQSHSSFFFEDMSPSVIKHEESYMGQYQQQQQDLLCQPVIFFDNFIDYDFTATPMSNPNEYYNTIATTTSVSSFGVMDSMTDFSSLDSFDTPDFVNPQMLTLNINNNFPLML